jgi:hypothetical protein
VGDPYPDELHASARAIAERAGLRPWGDWGLAWQSAGRTPEPWAGPDVLEELVTVAERGLERGATLSAAEQQTLAAAHALCAEGLACLGDALEDGLVDLEAARAREIRLNAREAEVRRALAARTDVPPGAFWLGELIDAYEGVGNRIWRVLEAAALEVEDPGE